MTAMTINMIGFIAITAFKPAIAAFATFVAILNKPVTILAAFIATI